MNITDAIKSAVKKADVNFETTFLRGDGIRSNIHWDTPKELLCSKCKGWNNLINYNSVPPIKEICSVCAGKGIPPIPMCELGD